MANENLFSRTQSVLELIRKRRSVRQFKSTPIAKDRVKNWIEAARWAPNHRLTEPWRFFVLSEGGETRAEVARLHKKNVFEMSHKLPDAKRRQVADAKEQEVMQAPLVVFVYSTPGKTDDVTRENYAAVCCAVQNFQLAACDEGFATGWSSGSIISCPGLSDVLGADETWDPVGALFIGVPSIQPRAQRDLSVDDFTCWL